MKQNLADVTFLQPDNHVQSTHLINSTGHQIWLTMFGLLLILPFLVSYYQLYHIIMNNERTDYHSAIDTFIAGSFIILFLSIIGLITTFINMQKSRMIHLKFRKNINRSIQLIVFSVILITFGRYLKEVLNEASQSFSYQIQKRKVKSTPTQQVMRNLDLVQKSNTQMGIELFMNKTYDPDLKYSINNNVDMFYENVSNANLTPFIQFLNMIAYATLFYMIFFRVDNHFSATLNLILIYLFLILLNYNEFYANDKDRLDLEKIIYPLAVQNEFSILGNIFFFTNWNYKRSHRIKSIHKHIYQLTEVQIFLKMLAMTGNIFIQVSYLILIKLLSSKYMIYNRSVINQKNSLITKIHVNEYFTDFFQFSMIGIILLFFNKNYELGRDFYVILYNQTYDIYHNYQFVIPFQQMDEAMYNDDDKPTSSDSEDQEQEKNENNQNEQDRYDRAIIIKLD